MFDIQNNLTGEICALSRSCSVTHPHWVHDQIGTSSEEELQGALDNMNYLDWIYLNEYDGRDLDGVGIAGLNEGYIYRWYDDLGDQAADAAKREAIAAAPELDGYTWKTATDEDGVFLILEEV